VTAPAWTSVAWEFLYLDLLARLALAALLGGIIGLEREMSGKPAGLRTNILICVGAALLTELSISAARSFGADGAPSDPTRIAAQIVSGIGFLGAGTIIQARGTVTGLTSAATLWVVAAIGIAAGAGAYVPAVGGTALVIAVLLPLGRVEHRLARVRLERTVCIHLHETEGMMERIESFLEVAGLRGEVMEMDRTGPGGLLRIRMTIRGKEGLFQKACQHLLKLPEIRSVSVER
jgi:putative Mg2+ transporter-C (MgtC) family protein